MPRHVEVTVVESAVHQVFGTVRVEIDAGVKRRGPIPAKLIEDPGVTMYPSIAAVESSFTIGTG